MKIVAPTVTEETAAGFHDQVAQLATFAQRLHLDFSDGVFSPVKMMNLIQAQWPDTLEIDLHLMYQNPLEHLETVISLQPNTAIIHAEADGDLSHFLSECARFDIVPGLALLPETNPQSVSDLISLSGYVLIFAGKLGYQGGQLDASQISKIAEIKRINNHTVIGWDGGITAETIQQLSHAGVEVFNVGKSIHAANNPAAAHQELERLIEA
jgi:ribulose-phosphate 3-epimerase